VEQPFRALGPRRELRLVRRHDRQTCRTGERFAPRAKPCKQRAFIASREHEHARRRLERERQLAADAQRHACDRPSSGSTLTRTRVG
jgi:hypothetical protein